MKITLNNKPEEFEGHESLTVKEIMNLKNFSYHLLVVRLNEKALDTHEYETSIVKDGDNLMIIHLITGG